MLRGYRTLWPAGRATCEGVEAWREAEGRPPGFASLASGGHKESGPCSPAGLGLTAALIKKKEGDAAWTNVRMRWAGHEMHGFPPSATRLAKWYAGRLGLAWRDPLYEIAGTFERFTADEMHERQNKSLAVKAFPELGSTPLHSGEFADGIGNFVTHVLAPEHGCDLQRDYYRHVASQMAIPSRGSQDGRDVWSRQGRWNTAEAFESSAPCAIEGAHVVHGRSFAPADRSDDRRACSRPRTWLSSSIQSIDMHR
jgi:hypothetical protein